MGLSQVAQVVFLSAALVLAGAVFDKYRNGGKPVMNAPRTAFPPEFVNPNVEKAKFAVNDEVFLKGQEYQKILKNAAPGTNPLPFNSVILCNVGNPQRAGQKPLTYFRQVLSLCTLPDKERERVAAEYPKDVYARAQHIMAGVPGGLGAYAGGPGLLSVRETVARFIEERDGAGHVEPDNIFLTDGATQAIQDVLRLIIGGPKDALLVPVPQYPLYSATITMLGGTAVGYYLDEEGGWILEVGELERALTEARAAGVQVKALVVINPGNPTGSCLTPAAMIKVVEFCHRENILLLADEVYQRNVYTKDERAWVSFRKVVHELGDDYKDFELISFHSVSKGFHGECGARGGYMELLNIHPAVRANLYKQGAVRLSPTTYGQLFVNLMVAPPKEGDESYALYVEESSAIDQSMKRRARLLEKAFNSLEGMSCAPIEGAMYAFPQIRLPKQALQAAEKAGKLPDVFYCLALLDRTGIVTVPGSGFDQKPGTWHFRTVFLEQEDVIEQVVEKIATFHREFMDMYREAVPVSEQGAAREL